MRSQQQVCVLRCAFARFVKHPRDNVWSAASCYTLPRASWTRTVCGRRQKKGPAQPKRGLEWWLPLPSSLHLTDGERSRAFRSSLADRMRRPTRVGRRCSMDRTSRLGHKTGHGALLPQETQVSLPFHLLLYRNLMQVPTNISHYFKPLEEDRCFPEYTTVARMFEPHPKTHTKRSVPVGDRDSRRLARSGGRDSYVSFPLFQARASRTGYGIERQRSMFFRRKPPAPGDL